MKVCHFTDLEFLVGGGIEQSYIQQREALEKGDVEWTKDPSQDFDILHLNTFTPLSIYHLFKSGIGDTKIVYHVHSTAEDFEGSFRFSKLLSPLADRFTKYIYSRADILIAPSQYTKELIESKEIDAEVEVVNNSYNQERLKGYDKLDEDNLKDKYNVEGPVVVNLAAVFERKGVPSFINCASEVSDADFIWFGSKVNSLLQSNSINKLLADKPDNSSFPGFIDDPREAFALGDIFLFPSTSEHQPVSVMEALYCGMPIVVRDIPQYRGWLRDGENCLKAGSQEEFEECLRKLIENPDLREKISRNAKKESKKHSVDKMGAGLKEVYQELMN